MSNYPSGTPDLMVTLADDGYSDFFIDYQPDDEQLEQWLSEDPENAIKIISTYSNGIETLRSAWCEANENIIESEWENR